MYGVLSRTPLFESLVAFCEKLRCSFGGTICRCMGLWCTDTSVSLLLAPICTQPVREAVSYRVLFTAGWFGVREKHYSQLEIYDRLRASEQADSR